MEFILVWSCYQCLTLGLNKNRTLNTATQKPLVPCLLVAVFSLRSVSLFLQAYSTKHEPPLAHHPSLNVMILKWPAGSLPQKILGLPMLSLSSAPLFSSPLTQNKSVKNFEWVNLWLAVLWVSTIVLVNHFPFAGVDNFHAFWLHLLDSLMDIPLDLSKHSAELSNWLSE